MIAVRRKRTHRITIVPYHHHPKFKWTIAGYYVNGKRVRRFFETKREAQTFAEQLQVKAENLGSRATHIDQRLHVMALESHDRLASFGKTLTDATDFYC